MTISMYETQASPELPPQNRKKIVRVTSLYQKQKLFCSTLSVLTTKRAFFFFTKRVIHCEETRTKDSRL